MSSEILGSAENVLKGNLGGAWDVKHGYADAYTDLGIARRFGGSAAAYSWRDIGAMNGPVVKVRRDVDGQGTDPEEDFSASQVSSDALEDWVNGKLETTLPADVATASAAYSLRKVRADYNGNAVRIRRRADDVEVNVAFDSEDKVSVSSPISNIQESSSNNDTTATDLNGFLNEQVELINQDFSTDTTGFQQLTGGNNTAERITTDGFSSSTSLQFNFTNSTNTYFTPRTNLKMIDFDGATYTIRFYAKAVSGSADLRIRIGTGDIVLDVDYDDNGGEWKQYTQTFVNDGGQQASDFRGRSLTFFPTSNVATVWLIDNFELIQEDNHSARVHTWYDQTDNNDAIEETAVNQPKIAENGSVFNHINFDGNAFLNVGANLMDATDGTTSMVMSNIDIDIQTFYLSNRGGNNGFNFFNDTGSGEKGKFKYAFVGSGASLTSNAFVSDNSDDKFLVTFTKDSNDREFFGNGAVLADDGASNTYTSAGATNTSIGKQGNSSTASSDKLMRVYEIISYNSDQSDNRFKIESNINNYYGLYNDANAFSANAQVDGTGSTVSNASKDGGTLTLSSASGNNYLYFQLTETVPATSGDIFISFNYESSDDSVNLNNVKLRDDADNAKSGDLVDSSGSAITIQKNGFYSGKLASANLTNTGTRLAFLTNQTTDGYTFTISNLRYSRIARNGFVETWYDQSGNGNNATQGTATNQPAIVENGGLVTVNSKPAIKFDGSDNYLIIDSELKFNSSDSDKANTIFNVASIVSGNRSYMGLGSGTFNWLGVPYLNDYIYRDNGGNIISTSETVPLNQQISFTFVSDESNDIETYQNGTSIDTNDSTFTSHLRIKNIGRSYNGANYNEMSSQEIVFYADDKTSDISDLHNDINNYYGI